MAWVRGIAEDYGPQAPGGGCTVSSILMALAYLIFSLFFVLLQVCVSAVLMFFVTQPNLLIPTVSCLPVLGEARGALGVCLRALWSQQLAPLVSDGLPLPVTLR